MKMQIVIAALILLQVSVVARSAPGFDLAEKLAELSRLNQSGRCNQRH